MGRLWALGVSLKPASRDKSGHNGIKRLPERDALN